MSISLSRLVQDYFFQRLINQRDLSQRTISTYRDAIKLFLSFTKDHLGKRIDKIQLGDLSSHLVMQFLQYLEVERNNTVRTRNNRLAALRSFIQYVGLREPEILPMVEQTMAIPSKKYNRPLIGFLSREEMEAIIIASCGKSWSSQRDHALLATLYNTGARVSEIINVRRSDVDLFRTKSILLHGKGRKERSVPLWQSTIALLKKWDSKIDLSANGFLFPNRYGAQLTRSGVEHRLKVTTKIASERVTSLKDKNVSPHVIRHTTAMHLLQSGVDLSIIALWLGHEQITTTHHYLEADLTMKEVALQKLSDPKIKMVRFKADAKLLAFLESL